MERQSPPTTPSSPCSLTRKRAAVPFDPIIDGRPAAKGRFARSLARTLNQCRDPILAWHRHGHTNGPVEGLNSLIKKVKRVVAGFTNFDDYRTRILLAVGGSDWDLLGTPPR